MILKHNNLPLLFYNICSNGRFYILQEVAYLLWKESWELAKDPRAKGSSLGPRIKLIEKASNLFAESKDHMFESKAAEEHAKLLR